jgi:hypothetical protein
MGGLGQQRRPVTNDLQSPSRLGDCLSYDEFEIA